MNTCIRPLPDLSEKNVARFWKKVQKGEPDQCWPWVGATNSYGYGTVGIRVEQGKDSHWLATRLSYKIATGSDPGSLWVLHRCNNPACVNPAHLYAGTPQQNTQDALRAGTHAAYHPNRIASLTGENNPRHKLTADNVREIRSLSAGGASNTEIAARFRVTQPAICDIVHRKAWAHIV